MHLDCLLTVRAWVSEEEKTEKMQGERKNEHFSHLPDTAVLL